MNISLLREIIGQFANYFQVNWYKVIPMNYFTRHLDSVDESYIQHGRHALGFAVLLFVGSLVCLVHAACPFLFERAGSDIIRRLHDRMVVNRHRLTPKPEARLEVASGPAVAEP